MKIYKNTPFDALKIGMEATADRLCVADDLYVFAHASGNRNPMHIPWADGDGDGQAEALAPSSWVASLISSVLGNQLPGPGTLYRALNVRFLGRAQAGDTLTIGARVISLGPDRLARFAVWVDVGHHRICEGEAEVEAPANPVSFEASDIPGLTVQSHRHFDALIERAAPLPPIPTAVVAPEEANSLGGAILAAEHTLITPILIGDRAKIEAAAAEIGKDISGYELIEKTDHRAAAACGVGLVNEGRARSLMKGHLHTDELLRPVLARDTGLRVGRRLSHIFVFDVPGVEHLIMVTDAAINIAPDLETKVDITQNAIDLALALGIDQPKVGILSAVETVTPKIPSTIDAAVLSKMAERGQITGGMVDGPLAMDNAVNLSAARTKGLKSLVAGRAEILVAPNMEAGNMVAKELTFLAHAEAGGIVIGARCPIILTSRADNDDARLASCAIAALYAERPARP